MYKRKEGISMQLDNMNKVSFGRIGFVNKSVKKAFYSSLDNPRFTARDSKGRAVVSCTCKWLMGKENLRHDRLLKIGMKQIKGKDYFTNAATDEVLGSTKRGRQNLAVFLIDLINSGSKKV